MLKKARAFFDARGILEVDCPMLSQAAPIDVNIDIMQVRSCQNGYLHSSPEYGMKRLLSAGIGDIYQISHVFRGGETGPLHNPEFTMAEWYRHSLCFEEMIAETLDFMRLFLGDMPEERLSYRETFQKFLDIDYTNATCEDLINCGKKHGLELSSDASSWNKDTLLQLLVGFLIEPHLGKENLFVLQYFPSTQAALSKTITLENGEHVGCRFEIYHHGMELCNGYHELTDPVEQRKRLIVANQERMKAGKEELKIDEHFLKALELGLPECCGVAVGFDRLLMLKHGLKELKNVLPLIWNES